MENAITFSTEHILFKKILDEKDQQTQQKDKRIQWLEEMIHTLRHKQFGASSEKTSADQINLFNEADADTDEPPNTDDNDVVIPAHTRKK